MGKTPSGRAGIYLSYKTFTYHKKTLNIFFFIFWSLNREIYQGGVTLVGQKKNLFCCWLRICAFTGLPQCFSTSCKHFTFTFLPAASVSVTVACENCTENSLQCSHLEKRSFSPADRTDPSWILEGGTAPEQLVSVSMIALGSARDGDSIIL